MMNYNSLKHNRFHAINSPKLNLNFSKFLHGVQILVGIALILASVYCYYYYVRINQDIVNHELAKINTLVVRDNTVTISGTKFDNILKFSKKFARRHNFKGIEIDGREVHLNDTTSKFYYVIDSDNIVLKSNYLLKPSTYHLKFCFGEETLDYNLILAYGQKFDDQRVSLDYWKEIPEGLASLTNSGIDLHVVNTRKASSLIFKRGYEKHIFFETEFIPHSSPLNMSLFLNLGTSIFLGVNDSHSLEIIQSKYYGDKKVEKTVQRGKFVFEKNIPCVASVEVDGNNYTLTLSQTGRSTTLSYVDMEPERNIQEKFKNFGIGIWKGSKGLTVKRIMVRSNDLM